MKNVTFLIIVFFLSLSPVRAEVLDIYKDVSTTLAIEGKAALDAQEVPLALQKFEQAIVADPGNVLGYIGLGTLYLRVDALPTSLKYFELALELEPINLTALELQAYAYLSENSVDLARENLKKMQTICFDRACEEEARLEIAIENHIEEFEPNS